MMYIFILTNYFHLAGGQRMLFQITFSAFVLFSLQHFYKLRGEPMKKTVSAFSACIPVYLTTLGDVTLLLQNNKWQICPVKIETFLMHQFRFAKENHSYYSMVFTDILKRQRNLPLYLHSQIYIPVKFRSPLCKGDSASGYLNLDDIRSISPHCIVLPHQSLLHQQSEKTLHLHRNEGLLIQKLLAEEAREKLRSTHLAEDLWEYLIP